MSRPLASLVPADAAPHVDPNHLSGDNESLGYLIRYAHRGLVKALAHALEPHGITTSEWSALRVLWREEGLTQVELAERMRVEKASLTGVLNTLETKGLIARLRNLDDRRKINLHLTAAGRALETGVLGCGLAVNERATRDMSTVQVETLRTLLRQVMANLDRARLD